MLTTNEKTIKLWKLHSSYKRKYRPANKNAKNEKDLEIPQSKQENFKSWDHEMKRSFPNFHLSTVNHLSVCSDNMSFVSADDLQVLLWNVESKNSAYKILDIRSENLEEEEELITSVQYHPFLDHQLICSSSEGTVRVIDLRTSSTADNTAIMIREKAEQKVPNLLLDVLASISDATYMPDGRQILTRDFIKVKRWDLAMPGKPLDVVTFYPPIRHKLANLFENQLIFERFNIAPSPCGKFFATGFFGGHCFIHSFEQGKNVRMEVGLNKKILPKAIVEIPTQLPADYNFDLKVEKVKWHPKLNFVTATMLNSMFVFEGPK